MDEIKKVNTKNNIRTVTHNNLITAKGLAKLSIKARKLLYIAISQCKITDDEFYAYEISIQEFADLMEIESSNVFREADRITDELLSCIIQCKPSNRKYFSKYTLFSVCEYEHDGKLKFKLNPDMTAFLLHINKDFSKPLLADFLRMRSPYSMAVWHLMQREMESKKPARTTDIIEFDLGLDELRAVTGTENKLKQVGQFKERVLDKAIREIKENCAVNITYTNIKEGRTIVGFHFVAVNWIHIDINDIPLDVLEKVQTFKERQSTRRRTMTPEERKKYDELTEGAYQLELKFIEPDKGK